MKLTKKEMDSGKLKFLRPRIDSDGVIILGSRAEEGFKAHYGNERFPILTYKDPLSHLWMKHVHAEDHSSVTRTVAKSRRKYWHRKYALYVFAVACWTSSWQCNKWLHSHPVVWPCPLHST